MIAKKHQLLVSFPFCRCTQLLYIHLEAVLSANFAFPLHLSACSWIAFTRCVCGLHALLLPRKGETITEGLNCFLTLVSL